MKKSFLTIAFAALALAGFAQSSSKVITLKGHVKFDDPQFKMEVFRYDGTEKVVVAQFDIDANNNFDYKMTVDKPGVYTLSCKKWESLRFWAEDEDIQITFRGLDTAKMKIKNPPYHMIENAGPKNELMNDLNFNEYRNYQLMIGLSQMAYRAEGLNDAAKQKFSMSLYDMLNQESQARVRYLAEKYCNVTSVAALYTRLKEATDKELMDKIVATHPNYEPLKQIVADQAAAKKQAELMAVGNMAPEFSFPTADGKKNLGPKDFKGKYLLIDFWASWCGPCRAEIPHLKEYYEIFKNKGVEFLSVSIDGKDADWRKAMDAEKMSWPQLLAPQSGKTITKLYQFSGIPFIILLDKEGKIVAKNLRGEDIKELLEKVTSK